MKQAKFSITDELRDELRRAAAREGRSESAIVRRALEHYLVLRRPGLRSIGDALDAPPPAELVDALAAELERGPRP